MSTDATLFYDFENIIPTAVAAVFTAAGLAAATPLTNAKFEKQRPRVDVTFKLGGAVTPLRIDPTTIPDGFPPQAGRNSAWSGELNVHAITAADPPGKLTHATYRATVRNACATLLLNVNDGTVLPYHVIQSLVETSTSHGIRTQDGLEQSTITFHVEFSINRQAWVILNGTTY